MLFIEFFGLEIGEFLHLFSTYFQVTGHYKGKLLTEQSNPKDTAENIYCFLHTILEEIDRAEKVVERKVLIEKYKQQLSPSR